MKVHTITRLTALLCVLWNGCATNDYGTNDFAEVNNLKDLGTVNAAVLNSLGENVSLIGLDPRKVLRNGLTIGGAPNHMLLHAGEAWVLNSTSHSLDVLDATTWVVLREYSLGLGCNPYMMALTTDAQLVVTCLMTNELLLVNPFADPTTDPEPILKRLAMPDGADLKPNDVDKPGEAKPQGVAVIGQRAYVTITNLDSKWNPAGPGFVQVVDIGQWKLDKLIELTSTNAYWIHYPTSGGDRLYVSCATTYDGSGVVAVVDTTTDSVVSSVPIGGAPGRLWVDDNQTAWVGDMSDGRLLRFSTVDGTILDPVVLCPADPANGIYDFISDVAADENGIIFAACFATDTVQIFNRRACSCSRITAGVGDGPQSLLVLPE
jgi:hypothetical protein